MKGVVVRRLHPRQVERHYGDRVCEVPLKIGLPGVEELAEEIEEYRDVLLGRRPAPIDVGEATLHEVAYAYFARACEIDILIHEAERDGSVMRGGQHYKFRTGELRSFLDLSKRAFELGSRRITVAQMNAGVGMR